MKVDVSFFGRRKKKRSVENGRKKGYLGHIGFLRSDFYGEQRES